METLRCPEIENLTKITPEEATAYVKYVAAVREQQRRWFINKDYNALCHARRMEKDLDALNALLLDDSARLF